MCWKTRRRDKLGAGLRRGRDPNDPAGTWDSLDALFTAAAARKIAVQLTLTGPVPKWATKKKRQRHQAEPEGVPGVRDRGRAPLRRPGRAVVDLERAQPPAVPHAAVRAQEGEVAAHLPQALPRRPARPPRVRQRRRHAAVRRDRAARHRRASSRRSRSCAARCASTALPPQGPLRADLGRRLRPPRVHDAHRPALPPAGQGRRHDRRARRGSPTRSPRPAGRARSRAGSAST